jgi:hypothetical protein
VRAGRLQRFELVGRFQGVRREDAAGRAADEQRLYDVRPGNTAGQGHDLADRRAEGDLCQTGIRDRAGDLNQNSALAAFGRDVAVAAGAAGDDARDHGEGLGVVDEGRLAVQASGRGIWGLLLGLAALALDALEEDRLLAQHVGALERLEFDVDVAAAAQNVVAQIARLVRLADRGLERGDRFACLGVQRDDDVGGSYRDGGYGRSLENGVGVAFEQDTIGEDGGIGLVGVNDDVAAVGRAQGTGAPLLAGGEARPAAAAQSRCGQGGHDLTRGHVFDCFG